MLHLIMAMGLIMANASMYYCNTEMYVMGDCESVGWQLQPPETDAIGWSD